MSSEVHLHVAIETPQHVQLAELLSYSHTHALPTGTLVRVPLQKRQVLGVVWQGTPSGEVSLSNIKPIVEGLDALPAFSASWCTLVEFAARYYQRSIGEVALSALPPELRKITQAQLVKRLKTVAGLWAKEPLASSAPAPDLPLLSEQQQAVLDQFMAASASSEALTFLLQGSTGSGKTEIYLRAAQHVLDQGRQALVLVPEINLTPQLVERFEARFAHKRIVALHSGLTPAQRLRHWIAAHMGWADLVLGTRLAVFASMPRLGLIVVDEEHDPSYKQQEGARYSARDLSVYRGKLESVPVLLGSATPSLESWYSAKQGRYVALHMPDRIGGGNLPTVQVLDMNLQPKRQGDGAVLAPALLAAIQERIMRGEQSLVFLNRRGYAPALHCPDCGWKSECPHCSAWRVFHKLDRTLRCHHCGFTQRVPKACPDCGNLDIRPMGQGTEKLEEQLANLLSNAQGGAARVIRIDADSTRQQGALESQLSSVHSGDVDVLVGTQMVTKGHDFRRITLVAAINTDAALFSHDFRAAERLFALLMQAAGRAGRDAAQAQRSEMWVQTWVPQHFLFKALKTYDFESFAQHQLSERRSAGLPPFAYLALLRAEAKTVEQAQNFLKAAAHVGRELELSQGVLIYPAIPPSVARVANVERMQMLVEATSRQVLQRFLKAWLPALHEFRAHQCSPQAKVLRWAIDVDPLGI